MPQPFKAVIRAGSLKSIGTGRGGIASAESHAKRLDPVAQGRVVEPRDPIAWCKAESGPMDYVEAFRAHKREFGAGERKGAGLAIEFKAVVSPEWLAEGGADPRDPNNPRVRQLVAEAQAWAESWGGGGSVWAVRYDTDEKGAGVVDLFMSPVRDQAHKSGKAKAVISCRKAKAELLEAEQAFDPDLRTSGAAMQSSWARWCQQKLDARIERGASKEITGREHVHAEVYAAEAEKAKAEAARIVAEAHAEAQRATERANEASAALLARLGPLQAAVEALEAWEADKARDAWWDMTPKERVAAQKALVEAARHEPPEVREPLRRELRQLEAEAGLMLRVTGVDVEAGLIECENASKKAFTVRVPLDSAEIRSELLDADMVRANPPPPSEMPKRVAAVIFDRMQMLRDLVAGAFVHLVGDTWREAHGILRATQVRPCDPPRPDPRRPEASPPPAAKPLLDLPKPAQELVRQALSKPTVGPR